MFSVAQCNVSTFDRGLSYDVSQATGWYENIAINYYLSPTCRITKNLTPFQIRLILFYTVLPIGNAPLNSTHELFEVFNLIFNLMEFLSLPRDTKHRFDFYSALE